MKKIFLRFWIVVLTFAVGITTTIIYLKYDTVIESFDEVDITQIPAVGYCDLLNNPQKYHGKIIALKGAIISRSDHGYLLANEDCLVEEKDSITAVSFYEPKREEILTERGIEPLLQSNIPPRTVEIIANGRFTYKDRLGGSDVISDRTHLQFEIYGIGLTTVVMED